MKKIELMKKSKKEIVTLYLSQSSKLATTIVNLNATIKNYRLHLKYMRDKMDYLYKHPYATSLTNKRK